MGASAPTPLQGDIVPLTPPGEHSFRKFPSNVRLLIKERNIFGVRHEGKSKATVESKLSPVAFSLPSPGFPAGIRAAPQAALRTPSCYLLLSCFRCVISPSQCGCGVRTVPLRIPPCYPIVGGCLCAYLRCYAYMPHDAPLRTPLGYLLVDGSRCVISLSQCVYGGHCTAVFTGASFIVL